MDGPGGGVGGRLGGRDGFPKAVQQPRLGDGVGVVGEFDRGGFRAPGDDAAADEGLAGEQIVAMEDGGEKRSWSPPE